jgi:hypothetical protein
MVKTTWRGSSGLRSASEREKALWMPWAWASVAQVTG